MSADEPETLGEVLHRARQAAGEARPRPWPVEDWCDRDPALRALDEAMAAAVVWAFLRDHLGAVLDALSAAVADAGYECQARPFRAALEALGGGEEAVCG